MYLIDMPNESYVAVVDITRSFEEPTVVVDEAIFERGDPRPRFGNQGKWTFPTRDAAWEAAREADKNLLTINKIARLFEQRGGEFVE